MTRTLCLPLIAALLWVTPAGTQEAPVTPGELQTAIDRLGDLDFSTRMNASRTVRRARPAQAVPVLIEAVTGHADGYVRYRALVLLSGFNDPRTESIVLPLLSDPNDRLRASAYAWFERHRSPQAVGPMLKALEREESEFVRPELTRALAAYAVDEPKVRDVMRALANRGQDFFRSVVIEALGDYKAGYAFAELSRIAQLDGPLQDDAVIALGKIGDKRALPMFVALQRSAPRDVQPSIAAAICLLGVNCPTHQGYLLDTIRFAVKESGFQELLRPAVSAVAAIASQGDLAMLRALIEIGAPLRDPARAPVALGIGSVALKNPALVLQAIEQQADAAPLIDLLREAFDMLEEDFAEEQFFAAVRRAHWGAEEGSPTRRAAGLLIRQLEF
jgi:HEAT repeat protein